jgi:hypothetical protein
MGKKCIPGVICIENMTLLLLVIILFIVVYIFWANHSSTNTIILQPAPYGSILSSSPAIIQAPIATRTSPTGDVFSNPFVPPSKVDGVYHPPDSSDVRGVPINIQTRSTGSDYQQVGILTKSNGSDLILPLFGRKIMTGRDKWQYYAISNTGNLNTKLPISVNGRSCTGEMGCDSMSNGDTVFVEGYKDIFKATLYENSLFNYLPF